MMREPLAKRVELRASEADLLRWQTACERVGLRSVSAWIRRTLNQEAGQPGSRREATQVRMTRLENGVRVVTDCMPGMRSVAMGVLIEGGIYHESPAQAGLAHLCEHLTFEGTSSRSAGDIAFAVDSAGGQVGAFTARDYTCYHASVVDEYSFDVLDLLGDVLLNSIYPEASVERQRRAIAREEEAAHDNPECRVLELLKEQVWPVHALGRSISGTAETLASLTREDVIHFVQANYTPDRLIVAAAGSVQHEDFVAQARDVFWRMIGTGRREPQAAPAWQQALAVETLPCRQTYFCVGLPVCAYADPDRYITHSVSRLLGGGASSRLFRDLRVERGLVYGVHTCYHAYQDAGFLTIQGSAAPEDLPEVLARVGEHASALALGEKPAAEEELALARLQLRCEHLAAGESAHARMSRLATQVFYFGAPLASERVLADLEKIEPAGVSRWCGTVLRNALTSASLALVGPCTPALQEQASAWLHQLRAAGVKSRAAAADKEELLCH